MQIQDAGLIQEYGMKGSGRLIRFVVVIVSLGLCVSAGTTVLDLWHRRDIVRKRQAELEHMIAENQKLEQQLSETKKGSYVERIARDKLGFVKEGEAVVLLPSSQNGDSEQEGGTTSPTWQQWWSLFY